jgi:hypothetical protein
MPSRCRHLSWKQGTFLRRLVAIRKLHQSGRSDALRQAEFEDPGKSRNVSVTPFEGLARTSAENYMTVETPAEGHRDMSASQWKRQRKVTGHERFD